MKSQSSVLLLYDPTWTNIPTVREFLQGLQRYSRHHIVFSPAYESADSPTGSQIDEFDAVVVHYSVRLTGPWARSGLADRVRRFKGPKVAFLQDEYEDTEAARSAIEDLGIELVFTCVPQEEREKFYPAARFRNTAFIQTLSGCVPLDLERRARLALPFEQRTVEIGYRGRRLGYWYGSLAMEKWWIGRDVRRWCEERGVTCDIEWSEQARLYGDDWFAFLGRSVATLGCESGANIIDEHGDVRRAVEAYLQRRPDAEYEEVHAACLRNVDTNTRMNQISPRVFEAAAMRTALILYEGEYSGVLEVNRHYFPLNKDGSNFDDIVRFLRNPVAVREMTDRAYRDLVESGRYSYPTLAQLFDASIDPILASAKPPPDVLPAVLSACYSDGSLDRLQLEPVATNTRQAIRALRAGVPSRFLLNTDSEFVVLQRHVTQARITHFRSTELENTFEARVPRAAIVEYELNAAAARATRLEFSLAGKETASVEISSSSGRAACKLQIADRLRLVFNQPPEGSALQARLLIRRVRAIHPMQPLLARIVKDAWHQLPLKLRLSPPAMRAKATLRSVSIALRRVRQASSVTNPAPRHR